MKKKFSPILFLALLVNFSPLSALGTFQKSQASTEAVSTDTVYYVDFKNKPAAFTTGDVFTASSSNANKEKTVNGIIFGAGPNGQRINMNITQSASQYGSSATTYVSASANDDGATAGAFSFLTTGTGSASGGYIILPEVQGPTDITIWACGANTGNTQSYKLMASSDGGTTWTQLGTASFTDLKLIHKNVFSYTGSTKVKIKLVCSTGSNSSCNLYIYDALLTKRPAIDLTSAVGTNHQTIATLLNESLTNIVYTWGGNATSAAVTWTGTADANTPPTGISVTTDVNAKTVTISGTPTALGTYSFSITSTNGSLTSSALTGSIRVVSAAVPLLTLTSVPGTNSQKVTAGSAMTAAQYTWGGSAFDAKVSWTGTTSSTTAPDGIIVTKDSLNEIMTISGTPNTSGTYGWSITSNDSTQVSTALTGTLTVVPPPTISLTSDAATTNQTVPFCIGMTNVVLTYGGSATSASLTWSGTPSSSTPPAGITVSTNTTAKTITISGMPYLTGTFSYSATSTDGAITSAAVTGKIISSATSDALPSFPGAVGYGSHATGGRKGSVYHVTNLDDSGPGSFRDAVSASNRIIVFDVSGYINLLTAVSCKSNLTIAGQTAPGEGIGFRGGEISFANQQNIICRHVRIVPGSETASTGDDALSLYLARNVIMDHCTFEFAPWNNIDGVSDNYTVYPVTGITLQSCIDANPTGQQFGAHCESVNGQWTFYRNLFANSHNRNPLSKINDQFINNVHYNNEAGYTTHTSTNFKHDIVNNYFVWGPASGSNVPWFQIDANQSIYYPGNLNDDNEDGVLNGTSTTPYWYSGTGTILTSPWSPLTPLIPTVDAPSAFRSVISNVGTLPLSQLDSMIINQVKTLGLGNAGYTAGSTGPSGGLYTTQAQTGLTNNGYGIIRSGVKATDTDNDGMPDYWEIATGSNVNADDAMQIASDGYTLIEHYINWLAELHATTNNNVPLDIDLNQYCGGFSSVSPVYTVSDNVGGTATILADGHTARFTPSATNGLASFKFKVTGSDGTSYTNTISIALLPANTSAVNMLENRVSIYPNPASDILVIENAQAGAFRIFDALGHTVLAGNINQSGASDKINIAALNTGVYVLKLTNDSKSAIYKFVKK
ncbi:MAG: T9SS type A sorting domain-containing protein [Bacteroidota bacterium]|nr:T9SS type A sorting domain-containing protein [Bacteroidota bacterium]